MATHVNRRRPSVSWDPNPTYYRIEPRDDSPSTPATPQQALADNHPQQLPRSLSGMPHPDPRAYQQQSSQVPGMLPLPGQYAQPTGSVYPAFHAQYLAGNAPQHAAPGANHYAAGFGDTSDLVGGEDRSGTGYGYPTSEAAPTPSAPLMTNASLPSTPSETPPTHSPATSSSDPLPDSPHARSSSWGTPSPEPDEQTGPRADLSPRLVQFMLKWDVRDKRLGSLQRPRWFQEQAFLSGQTRCTVTLQVGAERWDIGVPKRTDGRALTVSDVVTAIDRWLWTAVGDDAFFDGHPRVLIASAERTYRDLGAQDGMSNTFRNVDQVSESSRYFLGLDEIVGKNNASTLYVRVGSKPLV
ncbi:hypothetical protein LXA43DRAFT_674069 [Ganoderma leucocontextum]|nr:hypothetical protein LXA43DRAFT_674069 [Ganoderma leucocontextum]